MSQSPQTLKPSNPGALSSQSYDLLSIVSFCELRPAVPEACVRNGAVWCAAAGERELGRVPGVSSVDLSRDEFAFVVGHISIPALGRSLLFFQEKCRAARSPKRRNPAHVSFDVPTRHSQPLVTCP